MTGEPLYPEQPLALMPTAAIRSSKPILRSCITDARSEQYVRDILHEEVREDPRQEIVGLCNQKLAEFHADESDARDETRASAAEEVTA